MPKRKIKAGNIYMSNLVLRPSPDWNIYKVLNRRKTNNGDYIYRVRVATATGFKSKIAIWSDRRFKAKLSNKIIIPADKTTISKRLLTHDRK